MKMKVIPIMLLFIFLFASQSLSERKVPVLFECDCYVWDNYEDDTVASWDNSCRREMGYALPGDKAEDIKREARGKKISYIMGLMNAYNNASLKLQSGKLAEKFRLPYRIGQYIVEIDEYCKEPKNKDKKISEVLLIVNKILKER